ncbi:MAG: monofunctional biosynthetic peptidoglycan transglycosylase [Bacteroidales bacterium]|jgi:monofunctional biosynthetic peptidoglycan transglycosylase|nr:monofunctional biosynthetic peptidoglycan transglycosylase [Bacteroidales bacterium]
MKLKRLKKFVKTIFLYVSAGFFSLSVLSVVILKWMPVYVTPLMIQRYIENFSNKNYHISKQWVSLSEISPDLQLAVMAGEDSRFLDHSGFDWVEIDNAIEAGRSGRKLRGASTISQQTARNVFLLPCRSWIRKGLEAYFTKLIEWIWGKKRIMEVYLNVAEMGRGIFGAQAAAVKLFGTDALHLPAYKCALIAACLPNPNRRHAEKPSGYVKERAGKIMYYMVTLKRPGWLSAKKAEHKNKRRK